MSTRFYYRETNVKPLTLHATDSLFSCRGCNARRIRFQRRGTTTAGCFSLDPQKITNLSSHLEIYFTETFKVFESCGQILFSRASVKNWVWSAIGRIFSWYPISPSSLNLKLSDFTRLVHHRWISNGPTLNIIADDLPNNFQSRTFSNGPAKKQSEFIESPRSMNQENV